MQRKLTSMLVLAAAIAAPAAVLAAGTEPSSRPPSASSAGPTGNPGAPMTLNSLDTNKDGHVSKDEAKNSSQLSRDFSKLDKNNDGKLSADELAGSSPAPASSPLGSATSK
jgi:hypothetical protein